MQTCKLSLISCILLLAVSLINAGSTNADVLSYNGSEVASNIAIIEVTDEGVEIELEIYVDNIDAFVDLIPSAWVDSSRALAMTDEQRVARFAKSGLSITTSDGQHLPLKVELVEPRHRIDRASPLAGQMDPITGRTVPSPPDDSRVVFARLFYPFGGQKPDQITITPPLKGDTPAVVIGMQVSDRQVPVSGFQYLSGPSTLKLDWLDPWHSSFSPRTLNRQAQDGTMTFLYVEPRELRQEILIRLRELAPYINYDFKLASKLDADAQAELMSAATEFFLERSAIKIDNRTVEAEDGRSRVLVLDANGFQVLDSGENAISNAAFIGVILSYPITSLPETVTVEWNLFDDKITSVPVVMTDEAGPFISGVTAESPSYQWTNHLLTYQDPRVVPIDVNRALLRRVEFLTLGLGVFFTSAFVVVTFRRASGVVKAMCITAASIALAVGTASLAGALNRVLFVMPDRKAVEVVLGQTVENLNVAGLEVTQEARREMLATITTPNSRDAVASEVERGLAIRVPGGGLARARGIQDLTAEEITPLSDGPGFSVLASWTMRAKASHWGHDHNRILRYRALAELVPFDETWRLNGLTVLEARLPDV